MNKWTGQEKTSERRDVPPSDPLMDPPTADYVDMTPSTAQRPQPEWPDTIAFLVTAGVAIVAAGLLSAISASSPSHDAAWAVAYLVLVVGVAQVGFGLGQAMLVIRRPARLLIGAQWATYNLGNAGVILGTLSDRIWLVDLGGGLLVSALAMFFATSLRRHLEGRSREHRRDEHRRNERPRTTHRWTEQRWLLTAYRALILCILFSVPVGLFLARR